MEKNIYIHIGTAKTGTSAIQKYLFENSGKDYKYVNAYLNKCVHFNRCQYAHDFSLNAIKDRNIDLLINEIDSTNYKNYILSNEYLYHYLDQEDIKFLHDKLSKYNTTIICYVRIQDQFVDSIFAQFVKLKQTITIDPFIDFVNSHISNNEEKHGNYFNMLTPWSLEFENILINKFEKSSFYKNNLISDFLKNINVETEIKDSEIVNEKLSLNVVAYLKACMKYNLLQVNVIMIEADYENFVLYLIDNLEKLENNETSISYENRKKIIESYSESNKKLYKKYNIEPFEDIIEDQYKNFFDIDSVTLEQAKSVVDDFNKIHLK